MVSSYKLIKSLPRQDGTEPIFALSSYTALYLIGYVKLERWTPNFNENKVTIDRNEKKRSFKIDQQTQTKVYDEDGMLSWTH